MNRGYIVLLLSLCVASRSRAGDPTADLSVAISATQKTASRLGDLLLQIRVSNLTTNKVTVRTIESDPPISVQALDARGEAAIITALVPKDGKIRNVDYTFAPNETKSYEKTIQKSLLRGQSLSETASGKISVYALLPVIRLGPNGYEGIMVRSNTLSVIVSPGTH